MTDLNLLSFAELKQKQQELENFIANKSHIIQQLFHEMVAAQKIPDSVLPEDRIKYLTYYSEKPYFEPTVDILEKYWDQEGQKDGDIKDSERMDRILNRIVSNNARQKDIIARREAQIEQICSDVRLFKAKSFGSSGQFDQQWDLSSFPEKTMEHIYYRISGFRSLKVTLNGTQLRVTI